MINADDALNVVKKGIDVLAQKKGKLKVKKVDTKQEELEDEKVDIKSIGAKYKLNS